MKKLFKGISYLVLIGAFIGSFSISVSGAHKELGNGVWRVYLSREVKTDYQETAVWCWAATLSNIFAYYGHQVDQKRIAARYFPPPIASTASPVVMFSALNSTWQDDAGRSFRVSSPITDLFTPGGPRQISNAHLVVAIDREMPVFYADTSHAMVLVQIDYIPVPPDQVNILAGYAVDPFPLIPCFGHPCPRAIGFRQLRPNEMRALFVGIPQVSN